MKNKLVKNLALNMAFFQLFSSSIMPINRSIDKFDYSLKTKIVSSVDSVIPKSSEDTYIPVTSDDNISTYLIKDNETGEYRNISIFDYENIKTNQYGASQTDFRSRLDALISEPLIWEEMQKYYPVEDFYSKEEAMFFYEKYFDIIYDCGCGYAVAANYAFQLFEGHEEEFYNTFGFPMYSVNNDVIDFNYELFMLKFFNYYNLDVKKSHKLIIKSMGRLYYENKLKAFKKTNKVKRPDRKETENWTQADWDKWYALCDEYDKKVEELEKQIINATKEYTNFGIPLDVTFGELCSFLGRYGIQADTTLAVNLNNPNISDIISSDKFTLYKVDSNGKISHATDVEEHYIYITEIKDDGTIIVSSWGNMYIYDNSNARWTQKIVLKCKNKESLLK